MCTRWIYTHSETKAYFRNTEKAVSWHNWARRERLFVAWTTLRSGTWRRVYDWNLVTFRMEHQEGWHSSQSPLTYHQYPPSQPCFTARRPKMSSVSACLGCKHSWLSVGTCRFKYLLLNSEQVVTPAVICHNVTCPCLCATAQPMIH
jgi:hypothetical protein